MVDHVLRQFGETEVEHLHVTVAPDHYVLRLDIAVNDARRVGFLKRAGDLNRNVQNLIQLERPRRRAPAQRDSVNELSCYVMTIAVNADFVDRKNVWMIERRSGAGFLLKSIYAIAIGGELFTEKLERDLSTQLGIFGQIDFTHSARAELLENS